ncbi:MAG: tRNA pseudouridine(54/55) synthase Pus10 [Candidatus Methanofastidiosia archaeon]
MNWTELKKKLYELEVQSFQFGVRGENKLSKKTYLQELKELGFEHRQEANVLILQEEGSFKMVQNPLLIYGEYQKFKEMPQTKWHCRKCKGRGCKECNFTGRQFEETIEWVFQRYLEEFVKGDSYKFHGAGREDIDVLCYARRPFVFEVIKPSSYQFDLKSLEKRISRDERIKVHDLRFCSREEVRRIKNTKYLKMYLALISCDDFRESKLEKIVGKIRQETPERVSHRRAKKVREKEVYLASYLGRKDGLYRVVFITEHGTYVKELISGDSDRTLPSLTEVMGCRCRCEKLYVIGIAESMRELLHKINYDNFGNKFKKWTKICYSREKKFS